MSVPWRTDADIEADDLDLGAVQFAEQVSRKAHDLRVSREAKRVVDAEDRPTTPPFDAGLLDEVLARPTEPPNRVEELIPSDAASLIVAQRKTGKTTVQLNLARSLITGEDFLGRFGVRKIDGRVGFLNYEVSGAQLARWADDIGVPRQRLYLVNLRGRRNPFRHPDDLAALTQRLRAYEVETLIVDPFGRAYTGASQNDPGEVGTWLADLDRFARQEGAGVSDVILAAHAGWNGERTRGSTALEDWADSIVTLTRDADNRDERYLRAEGRDVLVEEDRLTYDPDTRLLTMSGAGSRRHVAQSRNVEDLLPAVIHAVTKDPGITGYKLAKALRDGKVSFRQGDHTKAANLAVERGLLDSTTGARNATCYLPATCTDLYGPAPGAGPPPVPPVPIEGQVEVGQVNPPQTGTGQPSLLPDRGPLCSDCGVYPELAGHTSGCPHVAITERTS